MKKKFGFGFLCDISKVGFWPFGSGYLALGLTGRQKNFAQVFIGY